jgi:hypothetical protein
MTVELGRPTRSYDSVSISPLSFWADSAEGREPSFMVPAIDPMVTTEFSRRDGSRT